MTPPAPHLTPFGRQLLIGALAPALAVTLACVPTRGTKSSLGPAENHPAIGSSQPTPPAIAASADLRATVNPQQTTEPVWPAGYHAVLTASAQDQVYILAPDNRPTVMVNVGSDCRTPTVLELNADQWHANTEFARRLPSLGLVDATDETSPWFRWRYGYTHVAGGPGSLERESTSPELARIVRNPVALVGSWPNDLWLIVNEVDMKGPFSYLQRSEVYRLSKEYSELVFAEKQVGEYVERWARVPNGVVVQEYLLAPSETVRIALHTDRGRVTLLEEPARHPLIFGAVRDQTVLAVWLDSDRVRVTNWDSRAKKHERSFQGLSCGPEMFLGDQGISLPPCAFFEMQSASAWRQAEAKVDATKTSEETLLADLEDLHIQLDSTVSAIAGSYWFVARSEDKKWLVTNYAMKPAGNDLRFECAGSVALQEGNRHARQP